MCSMQPAGQNAQMSMQSHIGFYFIYNSSDKHNGTNLHKDKNLFNRTDFFKDTNLYNDTNLLSMHRNNTEILNSTNFENSTDHLPIIDMTAQWIIRTCEMYILPAILCMGILGNGLCVIGLRSARLRHRLSPIEQQDASGLLCLAISDMAFCFVGALTIIFPPYYISRWTSSSMMIISFYYDNYRIPMLNVFILSSTWLTVIISLSKIRGLKSYKVKHKQAYRWICSLVFIISIMLTLPQFLNIVIKHGPCSPECYCYYIVPGFPHFIWYRVIWHIYGTFLPCGLLIYANCKLIYKMNKNLSSNSQRHSTSKITLILVLMISLFMLLVLPSMILTLVLSFVLYQSECMRIAVAVTNLLQAIHFACHFVLYVAISRQFRHSLSATLCCCCRASTPQRHSRYRYEMEVVVPKDSPLSSLWGRS